ncbi:MAG: helix-turn-helix transcriptional regulator [Treponema sp.]|nr:helix-turn-helix transcriptional regulator [Treponema sp.]
MGEYQKCFIENMKYYRKIKGLTQAELAEQCNVSNGTIGNIETGLTKPSFDLIIQLSMALGIKPEYLFHTEEHVQQPKKEDNSFSKYQLERLKNVLDSSVTEIIKSLKSKED